MLLPDSDRPAIIAGGISTMLRGDRSAASLKALAEAYRSAGADFILTDTLMERDYNATLRSAAATVGALDPCSGCMAAGSIGPSTRPRALYDAGIRLAVVETSTSINYAIRRAGEAIDAGLDVIISATLRSDGTLLSGETAEQFLSAAGALSPFAVGFNCGEGAHSLMEFAPLLYKIDRNVILYPSAGVPGRGKILGPEEFAEALRPAVEARRRHLIIGGCCMTSPAHIRALRSMIERQIPESSQQV